MKQTILLTLLLVVASLCSQAKETAATLCSPNGVLKVSIDIHDGNLRYTIYEGNRANDNIYALNNKVGLNITGTRQSHFITISKPKRTQEHFDIPNCKLSSFESEYNQVTVKNRNGINVEFRAYDCGVAYRFIAPTLKKDWKVLDEVAEFNFPDDYTAYLPYSTNESNPKAMAFQATYDVVPLSQVRQQDIFLPATIDCGKAKVTILETDVQSYPGMFLTANGKGSGFKADFAKYPKTYDYYPWRMQKYVKTTEDYIAQGQAGRNFPWRVLVITHDDTEMPTNTLSYQLAAPSRIKGNTGWIRPGKVAWDWWNDWGLKHVGFKAGINQDTYKYYIDFASENHLEYIILDEGWYDPKTGDMLTVVPQLNLPELVEYGKRKNVGIILWTVFNVLDQQLDAACKLYADMGIKGFKVDFLDRYDQEAVDMIYRIAERCAQSQLILDYHGIFPPQGITRTWPNVVNFEAVFGMEEVKWTERERLQQNGRTVSQPSKDMPRYDVTFPYIRGMVGPVDYTPGGMRNATRADFQPIYNNPMTMGTRCHQLACYVIHDSQLTMLADNPTAYKAEPQYTSFVASLPTVYDEMRCIGGKLGEYIAIARRKAVIIADSRKVETVSCAVEIKAYALLNAVRLEVELYALFVPCFIAGKYTVTIYSDGINADKGATDYTSHSESLKVASSSQLTARLSSGGGWVAKFEYAQ